MKMSPVNPENEQSARVSEMSELKRGRARAELLTLDRVVEGENVDPLPVLDVVASVNGGDVAELDAEIVARD